MSRVKSIETMRIGLTDALARCDWLKARRHMERLRGIVIDGVVHDDPVAIRLAGHALQQSGERLELVTDLPMAVDATAVAWQLRADMSTAALAARVRPVHANIEVSNEIESVTDLVFKILVESNSPMSNVDLSTRAGKDPATISRALHRLEQQKRIRYWRVGGRRMNEPVQHKQTSYEMINKLRIDQSQPKKGAETKKAENRLGRMSFYLGNQVENFSEEKAKLTSSTRK